LNVVLGDFRELEKHFNEKTFDYVVSISALQWVKNWNDMKRVTEGVYYVLKDNGKVGIQFYPFSELELNMFCKAFRRVGFNCKKIIESFSSQKRVVLIVLHKLKGVINIMRRVRYGGNVQAYKLSRRVKIDKETIKNITNSLAEELAKRMYYKLLLLKFLPEIKAVEKRKLKAINGKEIEKFLDQLSNSE
jgi:ubiquinone/menaquinone biosynthesis C-methylase UbiE